MPISRRTSRILLRSKSKCRRLLSYGKMSFHFSIKECIRVEQGDKEGFHASSVFTIGLVGSLQDGGIVEGLVAAHPKAKGMSDKYLFNALAGSKL